MIIRRRKFHILILVLAASNHNRVIFALGLSVTVCAVRHLNAIAIVIVEVSFLSKRDVEGVSGLALSF